MMTKQEIVAQLKTLMNQENNAELQAEIDSLKSKFSSLKQEAEQAQKQAHLAEGGSDADFVYKEDEVDAQYTELLSSHLTEDTQDVIDEADEIKRKALELLGLGSTAVATPAEQGEAPSQGKVENTTESKPSEEEAQPKQSKEESYAARQKIVAELESIIKTDVKNLGKHFQKASALQDRWKATQHYSTEEFKILENQYRTDLDKFYFNAKIVKDSIELDYDRNKAAKEAVVEKMKSLSSETDARHLEQKIKQYEKEWFRIGPVKKELREENRKQLDDAVADLQPLLDKLYEDQKEVLAENLKKKIGICEQLNAVIGKEFKSPKQYQQASDKLIQLQKDWREVGRSDENDRIWEVFRTACDNFFNAKRDYFKHLADNRKEHKAAKLSLIEKANKVKESTDWKKTADYLVALQKEWKQIGPAHPSEDQKLWVQFRSACDEFFNARSANFKQRDGEYESNLSMKKTLIDQVKSFQPTENIKDTIKSLQDFEKQYSAIGFVPFKVKDKIHSAFYDALNEHYDKINIDRKDKVKMRFESKIKSMATGNKPDKTLNFEEQKIRERMSEIRKQLASYEQNVSFSNKDENNPLVKMIKKNIKSAENEYDNLKVQLSLIKDAKAGKFDSEEE